VCNAVKEKLNIKRDEKFKLILSFVNKYIGMGADSLSVSTIINNVKADLIRGGKKIATKTIEDYTMLAIEYSKNLKEKQS